MQLQNRDKIMFPHKLFFLFLFIKQDKTVTKFIQIQVFYKQQAITFMQIM